MRLRIKLVLIIAVASVVPTVAATLVGRALVQQRSRQQFARLLRDGEVEVLARYRAQQEELVRLVERLADPEDGFIGPLLLARAGGGRGDDDTYRLALVTPRVMEERGLSLLTVLGPRGEIVASGHFPGRMGDRDPELARRARAFSGGMPQLLPERVMQGDKAVTWLTLQVWRTVTSPLGARLTVVGGRRLGPGFTRGLRLPAGTHVRLDTADGRALAGPAHWQRYADYPTRRIPLRGPRGEVAARVTLAVSDQQLRATLALINTAAAAVVGAGLLLALLLGVLAARRITGPVQQVVDGAAAVAAGDLEVRLPVRGRDEMAALAEAFNRRIAELKDAREKLLTAERVAAWREIARRIAHEIKNPLFPIQTSIETLQKAHRKQHPEFEEIFDESTRTILEEVERLKTIVGEFSRFARMPKPEPEPCDLAEVVTSVLALNPGAESELPEDLPRVMADRDQLVQVLVNLIKNALEAVVGQEQPRVTVGARPGDDPARVELWVEDNGPGFDAETRRKVFAPYFTTKGHSGGTGLGLAIVHRIVTDHGGEIEAHGEPGEGARFVVRLPRAGDS